MIKKIFFLMIVLGLIFSCSKSNKTNKEKKIKIEFVTWNDTLLVKGAMQQGTTKRLAGYIKAVFTVNFNFIKIAQAYKKHNFTISSDNLTLTKERVTIKLIPLTDTTTNMLFDIKPMKNVDNLRH